jgi:hypothetical protein
VARVLREFDGLSTALSQTMQHESSSDTASIFRTNRDLKCTAAKASTLANTSFSDNTLYMDNQGRNIS